MLPSLLGKYIHHTPSYISTRSLKRREKKREVIIMTKFEIKGNTITSENQFGKDTFEIVDKYIHHTPSYISTRSLKRRELYATLQYGKV